jgi:multicomponent Na+:H+ antiporter subunit C
VTPAVLYIAAAVALFGLGWAGLLLRPEPLRKLIAVNVMGLGVLMLLVAFAYRGDAAPDPIPHALAITGIVVAVAATALGLVLIRRARAAEASEAAEAGGEGGPGA